MTTLHYPSPGDWLLSNGILDDAMHAIDERFDVNRDFHVPYLAGYSKDGGTIYIDSRMPEGFEYRKARKLWIPTDQFLIVHEGVEKALLAFFAKLKRPIIYEFAHQIALRTEKDSVQAFARENDIDPDELWEAYNKFMAAQIEMCEKEGYENPPPNLDLTPYTDEHDPHIAELRADEAES